MSELLSPYQLIIFDWDGTLIDSPQRIINCLQRACRDVGCPVPEAEAIRGIIGMSLQPAFEILLPGISFEIKSQIIQAYRELFFHTDTTPMPLFEGVRESLELLKEAGHRLAIATGKSRIGLEKVLHDLEMRELFHASRCADETASKPDPRMLFELLEELELTAEDAVMIGDSSFDLEMAQRANIDRIAVTSGAHDAVRLAAFEPIAIHPTVSHFIKPNREISGF